MNVAINILEALEGDQLAHRMVRLFEDLLKDLNFLFWLDGPHKWKFYVAELRLAFEKLSIGLEASLADMREST